MAAGVNLGLGVDPLGVAPPLSPQTPDPLGAGGPPPANALSLPSVTVRSSLPPDRMSGITPGSGVDAPTNGAPADTPVHGFYPPGQSDRTAVSSATAPDPYTSYVGGAPYSLSRFEQGILRAEGGTPGQWNKEGVAYGPYQVTRGTASNPGFGIAPANSLADYDRVGKEYLTAMYNKYGPVLGAMGYTKGPKWLDDQISKYGDPSKGQITVPEFVNKVTAGDRDLHNYLNNVAGGKMALPGQAPVNGTQVAQTVDPGDPKNPLALPDPAADQDALQKQFTKMLMTSLLAKGFAFHPIDENPFRAAYQVGRMRSDYRAGGFERPRVRYGSDQGPTITAISPANVPNPLKGAGRAAVTRREED